MQEMYSEYDFDDIADDDDQFPEVMTAMGYLDLTEFARMFWSNPRVVWVYTVLFCTRSEFCERHRVSQISGARRHLIPPSIGDIIYVRSWFCSFSRAYAKGFLLGYTTFSRLI